jgi:hypothetical protein
MGRVHDSALRLIKVGEMLPSRPVRASRVLPIRPLSYRFNRKEIMSNSYDRVKSSRRNTQEPKTVTLAPAKSKDEKATGDGERVVPQPTSSPTRSLGQQLRIAPIKDRLKSALNDYSSANLGNCNTDPLLDGPYAPTGKTRKSQKRIVGTDRP